MKSTKLNFIKYFIIISLSFILQISAQEIEEIKLAQICKGSMPLDESHKYYKLTIPKNESNQVLIISTQEDSTTNKDMKDSFSDPDIYISKKNKYPSSRKSSEWFSEQYGSDILSIPSESVAAGDVFYIGMYCQFKCKYFLKVKTGKETEVILNEYYGMQLKPKEVMNYKIKINKDFEKLKVMAYSVTGGKFKMFMNKNSPSSANTYKVIPSWVRGYVILIQRNSREYCTNCEYHVIIHNDEDEESSEINQIFFYAGIEDKNIEYNLEPYNKINDALEDNSKICYNFNITEKEKREEKLIIDISVFSGQATLFIEGWRSRNIHNLARLPKDNNYTYNIEMEKYIILDKKDFDIFNQDDNYSNRINSVLHFCLYSIKQISYTIQAYYLTSLDKVVQNNILMSGYQLRGYLLQDQVFSYELFIDNVNKIKYNAEANITITLNKILGKTSVYGYFCKEENCVINKKSEIKKLEDKNQLLMPKQEINPFISTLHIPYRDNYCMNYPTSISDNGNTIRCITYTIIKCDDASKENGLCIYDIQFTIKDSEILMRPKQV